MNRYRSSKVRTSLVLVGVVTVVILSTGCSAPWTIEAPPIVGAWRSSLEFEAGSFAAIKDLQFMYVFNAGGTVTESSNYDGAPPVPPAYGVWRMVDANEFEAKYEFFTTAPSDPDAFIKGAGWLPSGRGVFTERITLSQDGQRFTSNLSYELFGMKGDTIESGSAKGRGVRIGL